MTSKCDNSTDSLRKRIDELEKLLYRQTYRQQLTGYSVIILPSKHGLPLIRNAIVRDGDGREIDADVIIYRNKTVEVDSNVPLDGSSIIIF